MLLVHRSSSVNSVCFADVRKLSTEMDPPGGATPVSGIHRAGFLVVETRPRVVTVLSIPSFPLPAIVPLMAGSNPALPNSRRVCRRPGWNGEQTQIFWRVEAYMHAWHVPRDDGAHRSVVPHRDQPLFQIAVGTSDVQARCGRFGLRYGSMRSQRRSAC